MPPYNKYGGFFYLNLTNFKNLLSFLCPVLANKFSYFIYNLGNNF
ncbi:hypothetical protein M2372_003473 [Chryseobacterium sp. BIGb0232]|nr:hypothetical protein [Chryseobacterium sp. BIGb0232]ROS17590.1 hypothetical protein EDF65_1962 [Chryseobacterium nakagawai]